MSDSDAQLVSIELQRSTWQEAVSALYGSGHRQLAVLLGNQIPPPFPTGVGAVIRGKVGHGEPLLVRTHPADREPDYLHWRQADNDGRFVQESAILLLKVLSPGVDL